MGEWCPLHPFRGQNTLLSFSHVSPWGPARLLMRPADWSLNGSTVHTLVACYCLPTWYVVHSHGNYFLSVSPFVFVVGTSPYGLRRVVTEICRKAARFFRECRALFFLFLFVCPNFAENVSLSQNISAPMFSCRPAALVCELFWAWPKHTRTHKGKASFYCSAMYKLLTMLYIVALPGKKHAVIRCNKCNILWQGNEPGEH